MGFASWSLLLLSADSLDRVHRVQFPAIDRFHLDAAVTGGGAASTALMRYVPERAAADGDGDRQRHTGVCAVGHRGRIPDDGEELVAHGLEHRVRLVRSSRDFDV